MAASGTGRSARAYHHGDLRRALVEAALALVTEEQSWSFSLREVARRAGVSHNAPYNHFAERRELLSAVAITGFDLLHQRVVAAADRESAAAAALDAASHAYARFALDNPALYRLMFGPELAINACWPGPDIEAAGEATRAYLDALLLRGAREGIFTLDPADEGALNLVALSCWSTMHGLVTLIIDGKTKGLDKPAAALVAGVVDRLLHGIMVRP